MCTESILLFISHLVLQKNYSVEDSKQLKSSFPPSFLGSRAQTIYFTIT